RRPPIAAGARGARAAWRTARPPWARRRPAPPGRERRPARPRRSFVFPYPVVPRRARRPHHQPVDAAPVGGEDGYVEERDPRHVPAEERLRFLVARGALAVVVAAPPLLQDQVHARAAVAAAVGGADELGAQQHGQE